MELARKIAKSLGIRRARKYELIPYTAPYLARHNYRVQMYEKIKDLKGSIVECGVGRGASLLSWCSLTRFDDIQRDIWAFDSFEGFPEPTEEDRSPRNPKAGEWGNTSIEFVKAFLKESIVDDATINNIKFVKGFFEHTMEEYSGEPIALLHLDVDLYQSYMQCLNALYRFVVPGGVVMFDEYVDQKTPFPGAMKAIDEFFGPDKNKIVRLPKYEKAYLIK